MDVDHKPSSSRGIYLTRVLRNERVCRRHWRFVLKIEDFPPAEPGQFVQILCGEPGGDAWTGGPLLRRPFSIADLRRDGRRAEIHILHRAVGAGTRWLSRLEPGDLVSVLGPLGRPFWLLDHRPVALLVGGGIGLPPLIWLARRLHEAGKRTVAFCGSRSAEVLPLTRRADIPVSGEQATPAFREFADVGVPVVVSTDDGSLGAFGLIADLFARYLEHHRDDARSAVVYTCGPEPMMQAVARVCQQRAIPCQVCLERMMACGMGTCQSCVVRSRDRKSVV